MKPWQMLVLGLIFFAGGLGVSVAAFWGYAKREWDVRRADQTFRVGLIVLALGAFFAFFSFLI